jgi:CheY-like chemotaxis protein
VDEKGHALTVAADPEPIVLSGDPLRLAQVVAALLSNAVRFTDPGGRIAVSIAREGEHAIVRVSDSGIGMEPELIERAFELFAQADQGLARTAGGLGIGLTLARNLARLHGGTLEAASKGPGRGSEFTLRLPIEAPEAEADEAHAHRNGSTPSHARTGPARILLVDDNKDAARSTELVLQQAGHQVKVAHDGRSAIEAALRHCPDLVILDVGLPQIDGYGVARELRRQTHIPLVALTGYAPEKSTSLLFDAYLVKPVEPEELMRVLATVR